MSDLVTISVQDHIADVRLNRPEKYNALSHDMFAAINQAGLDLTGRDDIRCVVLSGNGRGFCAGLDMSNFARMAGDDGGESGNRASQQPPRQDGDPANFGQLTGMVWKRMPVPVIAAMHGVAYGGGLQVALGADIRFAAPDARLSILEIKWGLIPDMGLTQTIRDILPLDVVKELTFTGRILSGSEAKALGLVTHVVDDPLAAAMELAGEIAAKSPDAVRRGKRLLETAWHGDERTGLELEASLQRELIGSPNQKEAVISNMEKRAPAYT